MCAIAVRAQDPETGLYRSFFGEESSSWNGVTEYWDGYPENVWMGIVGDTMLEGMVYKKIHSTTGDFLLREDRLNGRLWCRYLNGDTEFVVADLSLSLNDTISLLNKNNPYVGLSESVLYQVIGTSTTEHGRTITLKSTRPYARIIRFIEGVGGTNLFDCIKLPALTSQVICYHKDGELVYHESYWDYPEENCKLIRVGVDDVREKKGISVWPNPCEDWFMVEGGNGMPIRLYDLKGNLVIENAGARERIHTDGLASGVYILQIAGNEYATTRKLIKR